MVLYLVYTVVVALRGRSRSGILGLLALFGDTFFFLIVASYGADRMLWLAWASAVNKRRQGREIERLREKFQAAEKVAEKARELERVRIASDFHDGPLQSFISLPMRLEILRKLMERDLSAGM